MSKALVNLVIIFSLFVLVNACYWAEKSHGDISEISNEEAVRIASDEGKKLGYDVENMGIVAMKYTTPWNKYLPKDSESEDDIVRKQKLMNRKYWAVYFHMIPEPGYEIAGGDFCIFIDVKTGEIITNVLFE